MCSNYPKPFPRLEFQDVDGYPEDSFTLNNALEGGQASC